MKTTAAFRVLLSCFALAITAPVGAFAGTNSFSFDTGFTHQGRLKFNGRAANGLYDLRFKLFTNTTDTAPVGPDVFLSNTVVSAGLYRVDLDFGDVFLGGPRYIETAVQSSTNRTGFQSLAPRLAVTAVPYALWARRGGSETWRTEPKDDGGFYLPLYFSGNGEDGLSGGGQVNAYGDSSDSLLFPPASRPKKLDSINFLLNLFYDNGFRYHGVAGSLRIQAVVRALSNGTMLRTNAVSAVWNGPLALASYPHEWISLPLTGNPTNWVIRPGEILTLSFHYVGGHHDGYGNVEGFGEAVVHDAE